MLTQTAADELQTLMKLRWFLTDTSIGDIYDIVDDEEFTQPDFKKSVGMMAPGTVEEDITMSIGSSCHQSRETECNKFLALYGQLNQIVRWYCKIAKQVVSKQMQSNAKLRVYVELLKKFTNACEAFSRDFSFLEKALNECFEEHFPEHPRFPKFSFWRMFVRVWATDVHEPLQDELDEACLKLFLRIRKNSFIKSVNDLPSKSVEEKSEDQYAILTQI